MKTYSEGSPIPAGSVVSPKLDGVYARATKDGLFSKSGKSIQTQPHIVSQLATHFKTNPTSELHGELYKHGQPFEKTLSDFKSGKNPLQFHLFPSNSQKPKPGGDIIHIPSETVTSQAHADKHYDASQKAGYEGQVIQSPDGKQAKRKPWTDSEYAITGVDKGKAHGILTVRGTKDEQFRVQAPAHLVDDSLIGKKATIGYVRKTTNGVPHAPVLKKIRDYELQTKPAPAFKLPESLAKKLKAHFASRNSGKEIGQSIDDQTVNVYFNDKTFLRFLARTISKHRKLKELSIISITTAKEVLKNLNDKAGGKPSLLRPNGNPMDSRYLPKGSSQDELQKTSSLFFPDSDVKIKDHTVLIPREIPSEEKRVSPNPENDVLAISLHEHGHAADHLATRYNSAKKDAQKRANEAFDSKNEQEAARIDAQKLRTDLKMEKRANKNVLNQIKNNGSSNEAQSWKRWAERQMRKEYQSPVYEKLVAATKADTLSQKKDLLNEFPFLRRQEIKLNRKF